MRFSWNAILLEYEPKIDIGQHLTWSAIVIGFLLLAFAGVKIYRKWMNAAQDPTGGFTLSDLRKLHREGKMSTEEFEKAKAALIGTLKSALDKPAAQPGPRKRSVGPDPPKPDNS